MTFRYAIDSKRHFCLVQVTGDVEGMALAEAVAALYRDPQMQPGYDVLWDATYVTSLILDRVDFDEVRAVLRTLRPDVGGKGAVVAVRDVVEVAAAYMKASVAPRKREVRIFHLLQEARFWLGIDELPSDFTEVPVHEEC